MSFTDDRAINFNGEVTSLSTSAQKILGYDYGVAGTDYWIYEGESLDARRRRFEEKEFQDIETSESNSRVE